MQQSKPIAIKAKPRAPNKPKRKQTQVVEKIGRQLNIDNEYLHTLVDPENCTGVRYPDSLPKATGVFRGLINHDAYYFGSTQTVEPPGTYLNILTPTLINPLLEYTNDTVPANAQITGMCARPDDSVGLFPLTEDIAIPATGTDQMYIGPGDKLNMKCFWVWDDQDFAMPPVRGFATDNSVFYGLPMTLNVGAAGFDDTSIGVTITTIKKATSVTNPFVVEVVTAKGTFTTTAAAAVVGSNTYTFSVRAAAMVAILTTHGVLKAGAGLPGIGFRVTSNSPNPQVIMGYSIEIILNPNQPAGATIVTQSPRFVGISLPDELTYAQTVDQYRVVSMSNWLEYNGSDLKNGGQSAGLLYRGGQSALENGLFDYQSVAEVPESYAGALKHGTYCIWAPNSDNDMLMRSLSPHERWSYPYIVNAGIVAEPDQVNSVRLRIPINYEIVSTAQFYDFEKPIPSPDSILAASLALRHYPCAMANGVHFKWIKDVVSKAAQLGTDAAKWAVANKDWLLPAGAALATLL